MHNFEDVDVMQDFFTLEQYGKDHFVKTMDVLKPGMIIEIEVEVVALRSSTLPSRNLKRPC